VSTLGSWSAGVAMPLLVLQVTGSPAKTGIVSFAFGFPLLVLALPAGALLDRVDRKRAMIACDCARLAASSSVVVALAADAVSFAQLVVVAVVEGACLEIFMIAQAAALKQVVAPAELSAAMTQNQVREHGAILAGPPLGGVLYGLGRAVPFVADAASYVCSLATLLAIRGPFQAVRTAPPGRVAEGARWLWRDPFLRATSLLSMGSDFVINAVYLVVIVVARESGASSALIGTMLMFLGLGGVAGAVAAPLLARRLPLRQVVVLTMLVPALLVPLLAIVDEPLQLGVIYGAMFFLHPTWDASVGTYRLLITPDRLQGRVQSVAILLSLGAVPLASLGIGFLIEAAGSTDAVLTLAAVMAVVALSAVFSRAVRTAPPPPEDEPTLIPASRTEGAGAELSPADTSSPSGASPRSS
jgi:MFS family permease